MASTYGYSWRANREYAMFGDVSASLYSKSEGFYGVVQ